MLVNIQFCHECTKINFSGKDYTNKNDLIFIISAIASGRFCFEAGVLHSYEFDVFAAQINPDSFYQIKISNIFEPVVGWREVEGN